MRLRRAIPTGPCASWCRSRRAGRPTSARAKANPGKLNYGAGIITTRLAGYLFNREAGIEVQYIPFSGSPPTVQGLLNGAVDYIVDGAATSLPLIQGGKLRPLAKLNSRP